MVNLISSQVTPQMDVLTFFWKVPWYPGGSDGKASACNVGELGSIPGLGKSLSCEDPLEKELATHSSILAWKIPWTEEPGGLQAMGVTKELDMTRQLNNNNQLTNNIIQITAVSISKQNQEKTDLDS